MQDIRIEEVNELSRVDSDEQRIDSQAKENNLKVITSRKLSVKHAYRSNQRDRANETRQE